MSFLTRFFFGTSKKNVEPDTGYVEIDIDDKKNVEPDTGYVEIDIDDKKNVEPDTGYVEIDIDDKKNGAKEANEYVVGENGTLEYSPDVISDKLLSMFFKMVRNTSEEAVNELFTAVIKAMTEVGTAERVLMATNLFVLCFLTRSCRGGKGERTLFHRLFELIEGKFPKTILSTIKLIPYFGYWKDMFLLISRGHLNKETIVVILDEIGKQLSTDYQNAIDNRNVSLLAKWMPREGKSLYNKVNEVLNRHNLGKLPNEILMRVAVINDKSNIRERYRKLIVTIAEKLSIVESHMCDGTWSDINFSHVSTNAMSRYAHAFDLTEQAKVVKERGEATDDRRQCRDNYIDHLVNGKVNGKQVAIEKLVASVFDTKDAKLDLESLASKGPYNYLLAHRQFEAYAEYVKEHIEMAEKEVNEKMEFHFNPNDCELMLDVSRSMRGEPMFACIGLGLLVMRLQKLYKPTAKLSFLTFDSNPTFVNIDDCTSFIEQVQRVKSAPWGGSTNFVKAFDLMLKKSGNSIENAKKTLVVLSDMQFDQAVDYEYISFNENVSRTKTVKSWTTMYDTICQMWKDWYAVDDKQLPTIVFWNLRGNVASNGHPVKSTTKGVTEISGFSASLFKMVLFGEELAQTSDEKPTPSQVLARTLNAKEYDCVREALGWSNNTLDNNATLAKEVAIVKDI
jgi:Mg-chelatase subunit ChlD